MVYTIKKNVPIPESVTNGTRSGRAKYPFAEMEPVNERTHKGDCVEIEGDAMIRLRGFARERGVKFATEKVRGDDGNYELLRIWRTE